MKFRAEIITYLKEGIRDTQGMAIRNSLIHSDILVDDMKVGKYFVLVTDAENENTAADKIHSICANYLINPILEDYKVQNINTI